ncbi:MAG: hypothetical protein O2783_07435 [Chloroflexi bacterium]|nr:hypothetical protein [Chloroflexota bacterium]
MGSDELKNALRKHRKPSLAGVDLSPASTFDALLEQRIGHLERMVDELKARVNGLVFLVAGAVIIQIVLGLFR